MKKHTNFKVEMYENKADKWAALLFAIVLFGSFCIAIIEYTHVLSLFIY